MICQSILIMSSTKCYAKAYRRSITPPQLAWRRQNLFHWCYMKEFPTVLIRGNLQRLLDQDGDIFNITIESSAKTRPCGHRFALIWIPNTRPPQAHHDSGHMETGFSHAVRVPQHLRIIVRYGVTQYQIDSKSASVRTRS